MIIQGNFKYVINGENKTKEEVELMNLEGMDCTVDGLIIKYSSKTEDELKMYSDIEQCTKLVELAKKSSDVLLKEVEKYQQKHNGGILQGGEFPDNSIY